MSVAKSEQERLQAEKFRKELEEELAEVENLLKTETRMQVWNYPEKTKEKLMEKIRKAGLLVLKFNGLTQSRKIGLFDKLMKYVEKLKKLLEEYGKEVDIDSFSIQVGFPWGVSISFTFEPKG